MADKNKLIHDLAAAASMTPEEFIAVVKQRCFKDGVASDAQLILLLTIAKKYDLNPLAREVHAFINEKRGNAMEISIGLDGWIKIATRHVQFNGYEATPILNDQGVLTGIDMRMHRKDWKYPGVYTAWMDEWLVASQPGKPKSNWEQYPRHRLFGKAFQECARFTFGITEVVDEDDVVRIERATAAEDVIQQPGPAEPKALEHTPAMPMADFRNEAPKVETIEVVRHDAKPRGRSRKVDAEAVKVVEEVAESGGGQAGVPPSPAPVAAVDETLESFIAAHAVPKKRVDLALAKYGAAAIAELKPEEASAVLDVFKRSYAPS